MNSSSLNFRSKTKTNMNQLLLISLQSNYQSIVEYLPHSEISKLKQICKGIYYLIVTQQIWVGVKLDVVDKKMQYFDDLDFIDEEPKVISKEDKNIRIHSLKKGVAVNRLREASNIKQKKAVMATLNSELPFRSTEIGFKRLLKPAANTLINGSQLIKKKMSSPENDIFVAEYMEIPSNFIAKDLLINVKDPWSVNVQRASNLWCIVKKWNELHLKTLNLLKEPQKELSSLIKKCIKVDKIIVSYCKLFETEPYQSLLRVLEGSEQNLLIEEQLNKAAKIFMKGHSLIANINQHSQALIGKMHDACVKISKANTMHDQEGTSILELYNVLEQSLDYFLDLTSTCPQLIKMLLPSILEVFQILIDEQFSKQIVIDCSNNGPILLSLYQITFLHLCRKSEYFELFFYSLLSIQNKLLKIVSACSQNAEQQLLTITFNVNKIKSLKNISSGLGNVCKYVNKLQRQLENKEKKKVNARKMDIIRKFITYYEKSQTDFEVLQPSNTNKLEKEIADFKNRVAQLKDQMQQE